MSCDLRELTTPSVLANEVLPVSEIFREAQKIFQRWIVISKFGDRESQDADVMPSSHLSSFQS
jgi:hypothetical protein